jgi:hypothetical protein
VAFQTHKLCTYLLLTCGSMTDERDPSTCNTLFGHFANKLHYSKVYTIGIYIKCVKFPTWENEDNMCRTGWHTLLCQSINYDPRCPDISRQSNIGRLWVVRKASVNCLESRDISCYVYGDVRDRKVISAIACRRADAINHGGASIAPPGTYMRKSV